MPDELLNDAATAALEQAEAHLYGRDLSTAVAAYAAAETCCNDPDRLSGGRWMLHMLRGDYEAAHRESDAIRERGFADPNRFWTGEPIDGRRVMLRCLHGYGDTVMYLRWLPLLRACAASVVVQAAPEMLPLIRSMPDAESVVTWGEADGEWDLQVECAELPYIFRAAAESLLAPVRLVFPEADRHRVRGMLDQRTRPRVGLVWTGSGYDPARSIPFDHLRSILANRAFEFWSLQAPENCTEWLRYAEAHGWSRRVFFDSDGSHAGIADMAVFAADMDLVLTTDTLAAHVAGSLGVPTWLMLRHAADWRWMVQREDSPWYPAMQLFRQSEPGDWNPVLSRVCERLRDWTVENDER